MTSGKDEERAALVAALAAAAGPRAARRGVRWVAGRLRKVVHEVEFLLPLASADAEARLRAAVARAGRSGGSPEVRTAGDRRTLRGLVGSGPGGLDPVLVTATLTALGPMSTWVVLRVAALEGPIRRRLGTRIAERVTALVGDVWRLPVPPAVTPLAPLPAQVGAGARRWPDRGDGYLALIPVRDDPEAYYAADEVADYRHPAVEAVAEELERGCGGVDGWSVEVDPERYAEAAFVFVRDTIARSEDVDRWSTAYRASEVLRCGDALCHGKAHLLVALLRARGLPAGVCYQRLADDRGPGGFHLHALVATRIVGRWSRLDPRGGAAAGFDLYDARLAHRTDPARGETDHREVHAVPPPALRAALRTAPHGPAVYAHLPSEPR